MPTCTRDTLISGAACLNGNSLSDPQRQARKVWFMAKQLAAVGGTDYTADIDSLNTAANGLTCGMSLDDFKSSEAVIELNNAVAAGASVNTDKDSLANDVKCLENYSALSLKQMELLLRCALGEAAAQGG